MKYEKKILNWVQIYSGKYMLYMKTILHWISTNNSCQFLDLDIYLFQNMQWICFYQTCLRQKRQVFFSHHKFPFFSTIIWCLSFSVC